MFQAHRFQALLAGLGLPHSPDVYSDLLKAYTDSSRHYHGTRHISECLSHLDQYRSLASRPFEIELAIWFHDAVYDTTQYDNEERSAIWARDFMGTIGADAAVCARISEMILATKTHHASDPDAALMLDIDLLNLGTSDDAFEAYDAAIRREYHWVPEEQYRLARAQILYDFLERDAIYQTAVLRDAFEEQARRNIISKVKELAV